MCERMGATRAQHRSGRRLVEPFTEPSSTARHLLAALAGGHAAMMRDRVLLRVVERPRRSALQRRQARCDRTSLER
jgi:hypothetical protein